MDGLKRIIPYEVDFRLLIDKEFTSVGELLNFLINEKFIMKYNISTRSVDWEAQHDALLIEVSFWTTENDEWRDLVFYASPPNDVVFADDIELLDYLYKHPEYQKDGAHFNLDWIKGCAMQAFANRIYRDSSILEDIVLTRPIGWFIDNVPDLVEKHAKPDGMSEDRNYCGYCGESIKICICKKDGN